MPVYKLSLFSSSQKTQDKAAHPAPSALRVRNTCRSDYFSVVKYQNSNIKFLNNFKIGKIYQLKYTLQFVFSAVLKIQNTKNICITKITTKKCKIK